MARGRSTVRRTVRASRIAAADASLNRIARARTAARYDPTVIVDEERERAARLSKRQRVASASRSAARAALGPTSKGSTTGQWSIATVQQTSSKSSARMGRKTTAAQTALKLTRSQLETVIYRWNGVKSFDTNGYYWMNNRVVTAGRRDLPLYLFDLTSIRENPNGVYASPMLQLTGTAGVSAFDSRIGASSAAPPATGDTRWICEKAPVDFANNEPQSKTYLKSLSIKMNCWGAKTKAAQYTIQLIKFLDDELVPSHDGYATDITLATTKRTDFYQNLIKTLTFNPIAQTGGSYKGRMKVLKSETFTIQPNDTSDGDTDPNVRTVSMYVAMNRIISYQEAATVLAADADVSDNAAFAQNAAPQFKAQTRPKNRVYLMIRCSNYKLDTADSNVDTPSFDLMIRANHQITK